MGLGVSGFIFFAGQRLCVLLRFLPRQIRWLIATFVAGSLLVTSYATLIDGCCIAVRLRSNARSMIIIIMYFVFGVRILYHFNRRLNRNNNNK